MIYIENVQGTQDVVPKLEINKDTVYIRDNIEQKKDENNNNYWQYNEKQLTLNEYFSQVIPENETAIIELTELFSIYQAQVDETLAELSILIGGNK